MILVIFSFIGGIAYGQITGVADVPDNMDQIRAEQAKAKELLPPVAANDRVTIELVATMEDGKVRVYRLMDYRTGLTARTCHITVGELHGKTVTMDCED